MKPHSLRKTDHALTLVELLVIVGVLLVLFLMIDPGASASARRKAQRIACINNLKQIGLARITWVNDQSGQDSKQASRTNNVTPAFPDKGSSALTIFLALSNELATPKILNCLADTRGDYADSFANLTATNISYFFNLNAEDKLPQLIFAGDDNLAVNGSLVRSGTLELSTNASVSWTVERHMKAGNIVLVDGSVRQVTTAGLQSALLNSGIVTNHFVIP
jgi:prepilin-type processing-associated H-X9-DG protein